MLVEQELTKRLLGSNDIQFTAENAKKAYDAFSSLEGDEITDYLIDLKAALIMIKDKTKNGIPKGDEEEALFWLAFASAVHMHMQAMSKVMDKIMSMIEKLKEGEEKPKNEA